jgi:hypothetical protein
MIRKIRKLNRRRHPIELVPGVLAQKASSLKSLTKKEEPTVITQVPQITNETIAIHREEVLKGARKYIYPLQHSKHRIIVVTSFLGAATVLAFLIYCILGLYKFHQSNTFLYRVTQVVPFPIAKVEGSFVNYENYLFELRHYVHYYEHQQQVDFNGDSKAQLVKARKQLLDVVINEAYIKKLAKQHKISVSDKEVDQRMNIVRDQNRLGNNNKVFADVLRDYWGWSISDFKRSLKQEILTEKVNAALDTQASKKADSVLAQVRAAADFAELAKANSDAPDKAAGGDYGFSINKSNPNVPPQVVDQLFKLKPGQTSEIILASSTDVGRPNSLEIVKVNQNDGTTVAAQHISIYLKDASTFVDPEKKQFPPSTYVTL